MCVLFLVQYFCLLPILIQIICANITIEFYEEIDSSYKTKKNVKNKKKNYSTKTNSYRQRYTCRETCIRNGKN